MADTNLPPGFPTNLADFEAFENWLKRERQQRASREASETDRRVREQERQAWRSAVFTWGAGSSARLKARRDLDEEKFSAYQQIQGELAREERRLKQRHQQEVEALRARYQEKTTKSEQSYAAQAATLLAEQWQAFDYETEWEQLQWQNERARLEREYWDPQERAVNREKVISRDPNDKNDRGRRFGEALAEFKPAPPR